MKLLARNNIKPRTICEVGCGAGEILQQMQKTMNGECEFWGYDISPQAYDISKHKTNEKLHFLLSDFLKEERASFDLILAIDIIEHLENYYDFLRNIKSKSTYKVFHIPLELSAQAVLRGSPLIKNRKTYGHIHSFTVETALQILKDTGYEISDYFYTPTSIELKAKSAMNYIARFPRKILFSINKDLAVRMLGGYSLLVLGQ